MNAGQPNTVLRWDGGQRRKRNPFSGEPPEGEPISFGVGALLVARRILASYFEALSRTGDFSGFRVPFEEEPLRLQSDTGYSTGCHTTFHHRYHIVWAPKYRFKVLHGEVRLRVREIIKQVCAEMGVTIINGALSCDHVHMFVEIPPHVSVSDFVRRAKGRSSRKIQQEFEHIRKRYWGQRFWGRGYFSTTSGNITDDIIMRYLDRHTHKNGFSPST